MKRIQVGLALSAVLSMPLAHGAATIVDNDLLTSSGTGSGWTECGNGNEIVDLSTFGGGGCAYHEFAAEPDTEYKLTCAGTSEKFASITLAFSDANYAELASDFVPIDGDQSGTWSIVLTAPANTVHGAVGIYADHGAGFQDCVVVETTPITEPTLGSIAGNVWFDENGDSTVDGSESAIPSTTVTLFLNGVMISQTDTDASGEYYFGQLDPTLTYEVQFTPVDSSLQLSPLAGDSDAMQDNGLTAPITLTEANPNVTNVDAGFMPVPVVVVPADYNVCGIAWLDQDDNGNYGAADSILENVEVSLVNEDTGDVTSLATDNLGSFVFDGLDAGNYSLIYDAPTGHSFVAASGISATGSYPNQATGQTAVFNLPADSNSSSANDPCTLRDANAGLFLQPTALALTVANDDSIGGLVGEQLVVDVVSNDAPCAANVQEIDIRGHNVLGTVIADPSNNTVVISNTTTEGTYSIEYGLRGSCGSYDTAIITVTISAQQSIAASPEFNKCRFGEAREIVELFEFEQGTSAATVAAYVPPVSVVTSCGLDLTASMGWAQGDAETQNTISTTPVPYNTNDGAYTYAATYSEDMQASCPSNDSINVTNADGSNYSLRCKTTKSPIGLDIDASGTVERIEGLYKFDIDGDGIQDNLAEWFAPNEGILIDSSFGDVIDGNHLFGDLGGTYSDGYQKLALLDKNSDGKLVGNELATLAIWSDKNSNAAVDIGEISSLSSHRIVSLHTVHVDFKSVAILSDGSTMVTEDLWFPVAEVDLAVAVPVIGGNNNAER